MRSRTSSAGKRGTEYRGPRTHLLLEVFPIRKLVLVCISASLFLIASLNASAGPEAIPEIRDYPPMVGYRSPISIVGKAGDASGNRVVLQRRFAHSEGWKNVATETTRDSGRVDIDLDGTRYTAEYRLKSAGLTSEKIRIPVKPKLTLRLRRPDVMTGGQAVVRGALRPSWSDRQATLKWRVKGQWEVLDEVNLADGRFKAKLPVDSPGHRRIRVVFERDVRNAYARAGEVLRVHGKSMATWYGPGFFGNRTACGKTYHRDLLGVAHRTLPCGTKVSVLYRGRSVKVPVIDRGPYGHANWDLTEETAQRLRFSGRKTVGVLH